MIHRDGFSDTPMIAMSASRAMLVHAQESALFHDILGKPIHLDALLDTVAQQVQTQASYRTSPADVELARPTSVLCRK